MVESVSLCARRSANIILSLFSLMLDTGVPDIALEPDKTVQKVSTAGIIPVQHVPC